MPELRYDDIVGIIISAEHIPDGATVIKRSGRTPYTLKKTLVVYPTPKSDEKPIRLEGTFLVGERGSINQMKDTDELVWQVTVEELQDFFHDMEDDESDK